MIAKEIDKEKIAKEIAALWKNIDEHEYATILNNLAIHKYQKNEIIYKSNELPTDIWFLIHGKVKVYKDGIGGKCQIVRAIKPIEFFGFRAYFAGERYMTSAMALDNSIIASLPMPILIELMKDNFDISFFFINYLSITVGDSDNRTVNLTQKHIRARLAEALLYLIDSYGTEEDGQTLNIYLSREDLASLSNMTTSNAIRTLSAFASEDIISIDGRKIKINNLDELNQISQLG